MNRSVILLVGVLMLSVVMAEEPAATDNAADLEPGVSTSPEQGTLRTTTITGNAELPRVLYIVPWQKADPGDLLGKPVNSLLDELLQPIDRDEFRRQLRYYADINEEPAGTDQQ